MLKIILIIIGVLFLLFIIAMLFFASFVLLNKKESKSKEIIIKSNQNKKVLILYQKSRHKTATNLTMALAKELNNNGYTVTINHPSSKLNYNIEEYDVVAFGSTVYMGTISQPLMNYMRQLSYKNRNVILYLVGLATEVDVEIKQLEEIVKDAKIIKSIKVKKGEETKLENFAKDFLKKI